MKRPIITICSSINFYEQVAAIQKQLETLGYTVLIPATAEKMKRAGSFDVATFKPRVSEKAGKALKTKLMHGHFAEVDKSDACLVINNEKHGVPNYIGGNVLMEMALAFFQHKPILLLNKIPDESVFLEEIVGMQPIELKGKLDDLPRVLKKLKVE